MVGRVPFSCSDRVFVIRTNAGGSRFNYSEWVGNATGAAISNAYYRDNRDWEDNTENW